LAAAKVAELLDRYDLSPDRYRSPAMRHASGREYDTHSQETLQFRWYDCVGADSRTSAIAGFGVRRTLRARHAYVFFGLRSDIEVAHYLTEMIDTAVRSELGRVQDVYRLPAVHRHQDRHLANGFLHARRWSHPSRTS